MLFFSGEFTNELAPYRCKANALLDEIRDKIPEARVELKGVNVDATIDLIIVIGPKVSIIINYTFYFIKVKKIIIIFF